LNREELESLLKSNGILPADASKASEKCVEISGDTLKIGNTSAKIWPDTEHKSKVPHVLFYNIQQVS